MKNLYLLILFFCTLSCNDIIELIPISEISADNFWKTEGDAIAGLNGMYHKLRTPASSSFFMWGEGRSDVMGPSYLGAVADFDVLYYNTLNTINSAATYNGGDITWKNLYGIIHHANLIIKYVPEIKDINKNVQNDILAQAYTMRAYIYFLMVKVWGDIAIISEPVEAISADALQVERNSKEEVFTFIKSDIENALNLFPNNNLSNHRNKWSKPAANVLKADVYLWTAKRLNGGDSDLNIALTSLNEAEQTNSNLTLLNDFSSVFSYSNKGNDEIIMSVHFSELEVPAAVNWRETRFMYIHPAIPPNISQTTKDAIGAPSMNGGYWTIRPEICDLFNRDDQRRNASFYQIFTQKLNSDSTFYATLAYKFKGIVKGGYRSWVDDVVLYRYADILLLRAEVKNALMMDPSNEINEIRKRAYQNDFDKHIFQSTNFLKNNEAILQERLFEFILEGKRWWDLIRFGKAFEKVPSLQGREKDEYLLLFPIPEVTLSLENKMKQNPGYGSDYEN